MSKSLYKRALVTLALLVSLAPLARAQQDDYSPAPQATTTPRNASPSASPAKPTPAPLVRPALMPVAAPAPDDVLPAPLP
ncbi:MAG: hypothetical protein ABR563_00285, partial [Pyrinomonadaceae bacterium]